MLRPCADGETRDHSQRPHVQEDAASAPVPQTPLTLLSDTVLSRVALDAPYRLRSAFEPGWLKSELPPCEVAALTSFTR